MSGSATARPPRSSATATCCNRSPRAPTICSSASRPGTRSLPTRLALLDDAFAERVKPWPQISRELLSRACMRAADLDVQRAITSQPRLEVRLTLLLWHLAGRWGRVEHGGIRIALPLTHRLLGRLVGAERPSVSHALARLSQAGLVTSRDGALHLQGTAAEHLTALADRPGARRGHRRRRSGQRVRRAVDFAGHGPKVERLIVHVLWLTSGLSCDGESVSLTAATSPSLRGAAAGSDPGTAPHRPLQPAARLRRRRRLPHGVACGSARRAGAVRARRRGIGCQRGDQRRGSLERLRGGCGRPADHRQHVDRRLWRRERPS